MIELLLSAVRMSLPTLYATIGGYFSEKSGIAQIGLEAFLLTGAFTAASIAHETHSIGLGYLSAGLMAALLAQIFCYLVLYLGANSIVIGTGLNLFVLGAIPLVSKKLFESTGSTPALESSVASLPMTAVVFLATILFSYWLSEKTLWGLQMKFAGEKKEALKAVGVFAARRQSQAITYGAFVAGLGGATLSTYLASSYSPQMSAGRGYIALAAVIFSGWNLPRALVVSLIFGLCEAIQIQVQTNPEISAKISGEFIQMAPYLVTLFALLIFKNKNRAPQEIS